MDGFPVGEPRDGALTTLLAACSSPSILSESGAQSILCISRAKRAYYVPYVLVGRTFLPSDFTTRPSQPIWCHPWLLISPCATGQAGKTFGRSLDRAVMGLSFSVSPRLPPPLLPLPFQKVRARAEPGAWKTSRGKLGTDVGSPVERPTNAYY